MKSINHFRRRTLATAAASIGLSMSMGAAAQLPSMATGENGYVVSDPIFTVGETIDGYTPPGVLDGMGAYRLNKDTVRVLVNHELLNFRGYPYEVRDGAGGTFSMTGARVSYFDIDRESRDVVDSGLAYKRIYDANGNLATDTSFLSNNFSGFSRFCSSNLVEPRQFGKGRGLRNRVYFTGEEDGGFFNGVGGAEWALDPRKGEIWQLPDLGRGAWENVTELDTGNRQQVAILLADDSSPFNFDNEPDLEAAPLYLYIGNKNKRSNDFPARNGLRGGKLYVWVADNGATRPSDFNGDGAVLEGSWVEIDNSPTGIPSEDGSTGFDEYGYPTQGTLWLRAEELGAFGFSRPEDVATNPADGSQAVLASTGVDTFDVLPSGDGADTFGTTYIVDTDFATLESTLTILYDGDADLTRALRSPDNLDWADDGFIYIQEDKAETDSLTGELLFGPGAANPNEASIVRLDPTVVGGAPFRVAEIDRSTVVDAGLDNPFDADDVDVGITGAWESSGIIDVSTLFGEDKGSLFLFNVQAHGIEDQTDINPESRINDGDLVEGGQLLFLATGDAVENINGEDDDDD
jgi:hypothetical protein